MYSVDDIIENLDRESNLEDNDLNDDIERIEEGEEEHRNDEEKENSNENEASKTPKKTRVKREMPKLDAQRLRGPRGLTALEKMFENVKFKGDGHEKEDLDKVMVTLHHWCHRLFPKYTFDDCLAHLEKLGANKSVTVLKKSIRMGLIDETDNPNNDEIIDAPMEEVSEFDALLEQELHAPVNIISKGPSPVKDTLTDEQKEMIARNRLLAAERRRSRLDAQKDQSQNSEGSRSLSQIQDTETFTQNESNEGLQPEECASGNINTNDSLTSASQSIYEGSSQEPIPEVSEEADRIESAQNCLQATGVDEENALGDSSEVENNTLVTDVSDRHMDHASAALLASKTHISISQNTTVDAEVFSQTEQTIRYLPRDE